mmetsp:Transcript_47893/g.57982  ORF Transcript_47893/g.57982 Transcript_47893/m.57982 type:complete len:151 (+) Transcript_47893:66-518(+)
MKLAIFAILASAVVGFVPQGTVQKNTALSASEGRRDFIGAAAAAGVAAFGAALPANADRDYAGVGLLGGGNIVDINNANVRVYLKMPGLYPSIAGKIVTYGPYKSVGDLYSIPGLSSAEKDVIKKYESRFVVTEAAPIYTIDKINNGLYR